MRALFAVVLVVLTLVLTSCAPSSEAQVASLFEGMGLVKFRDSPPAPAIVLNNLQGQRVSLDDFRGKTVVVNFWATWSPPCKVEWPRLRALQASFAGHPELVFLSVDLSEPYGVVRAFLSENEANFPVLLDADGVTGNTWGIQSLPTTVVIDKAGRLLGGATGNFPWDKPEVLKGLLALAALK